MIQYLKEQLDCKDKELFLVVTSEVEQKQSWLIHSSLYTNEQISISDRDADCLQLCDVVSDDCSITFNPCQIDDSM